jgi:hypothetical protein
MRNITSIISWNGCWYGIRKLKTKEKYYKSHNVRFDDTCGGTEEITSEEYQVAAEKYAAIFK